MKRESKFMPFIDYLNNVKYDSFTLTFDEIEQILGFKMERSAYDWLPYWSWKGSPTHVFPNMIKDAGFPNICADLSRKVVRFEKGINKDRPIDDPIPQKCRLKINNPNDNPEKWILNGMIEISPFAPQGEKTNLAWLEAEDGRYHKFAQLPVGSSILVFDKTSYLKYKFITSSLYKNKKHGYLISKAFKCLNNVYLFKDINCKIPRNPWCSFAQQTIERYENEAKWEEIPILGKLDMEITKNLSDFNDQNEKEMFREGQVSERVFKFFERNTSLRDLYFLKHDKRCKLCGKEYKKDDGKGSIIDVHHLHFISLGVRDVAARNIDNYLVGLCPNCHRWVHSIKTDHELTFEEIKERYKKTHS